MQEVPSDPPIGLLIDGRYRIISTVAHGGMSTVYLAKDIRLNRNIALKILRPHLAADQAFIKRLQREAWSAASLSHPHVVQIHDHGVSDKYAYLVLEFIDGQTLRDVISQRGPLSPRAALDLLDPIVEGLAAAHSTGIIHGDIKPENVLISRSGWVKIGDFGLSRAANGTTNTASDLGTVAYAAPELVNRENGDARSDIYAIGILLYELLTGTRPFTAPTDIGVAMAHVTQDTPAPSETVPGLPLEMDELVRYLTEKDPDNRPSNGTVLLEDLRHIRRTLTPEQLDSGGSAKSAGTGPQYPAIPATSPRSANQTTEVLGTDFAQLTQALDTTVIHPPMNSTSVLPAGSTLYVRDQDNEQHSEQDHLDAPEESGESPSSPSKRQARVLAKAQAKASAKAASVPVRTLGSRHPHRRATIWILIGLIVAAVGATIGWYLGVGPGALATIPATANQSVAVAQNSLRQAGFETLSQVEVFDESVEAGHVVATDPAQGQSIRKFVTIHVSISKGPVLYAVPTVTAKKLDDAKTDIISAHLAVGAVSEAFSETVAAGVVISQNPGNTQPLRAGSKVALVVSKGPQPIPVPRVTNGTLAQAQASLKAVGLIGVEAPARVYSSTIAAGSVVSQSPADGTLVKGGTVTLTLSKGPEMVMVPNLVGKQVDQAVSTLEGLGFKVDVKDLLGGFFGTVRFQDPQGVEAPKGSTVKLQVI